MKEMTNNLIAVGNKNTITSLEVVEQINIFRREEGNRAELQHSDLLKIIRNEFEEEIGLGKISESSYLNSQNKRQPMFELTFNQAKQILMRESKFVRKAMIQYIEKLEQALQSKQDSYMIDDPIERAKRWIEEQEESKKLIEDVQRKEKIAVEVKDRVVDAVKNLVESGNGYTIQEVSKVLCFKGLGEIKMFKYLRDIGMLCSDSSSYNQPSITAINSRRMYMDFKSYMKDDEVINYTQTKITKKGVLWLYDRLIKEGYKTIVERDEVEELFI